MSVARVAARIIVRELAKVAPGPDWITKQLVSRGMSYRRQDMLRDATTAINWSRYREAQEAAIGVKTAVRETFDNYDLDEGIRYQIVGRSRWYDPISGNIISKQSSLFSDVLSENDEDIEDDFADLWAEEEEKYKGLTFVGFVVEDVGKNPDMPHLRIK
jgi:hypothetical protein